MDRFAFINHQQQLDYSKRSVKYTKYDRYGYTSPSNAICNQKYNLITFMPLVLFDQFKMFFNLYFLLVALSQFVPQLRIGYLITYVGPLVFVLLITLIKEGVDDYTRKKRDEDLNNQLYKCYFRGDTLYKKASQLVVGDVVVLSKQDRVPADLLLLRSSDPTVFIKTDQLDGETDWKLKLPVALGQWDEMVVTYERPHKDLYSFFGTVKPYSQVIYTDDIEMNSLDKTIPLSIDQTLWANTIIASHTTCYGMVLYTGKETKFMLNTRQPKSKIGIVELELNKLSKMLFLFTIALSICMLIFSQFSWVLLVRFMILFSSIIPISLRVNLDMAKTFYQHDIQHDDQINDTVVRNSHLPEELGRIEYLLSDKTGTLTKNEMILRKLHLGHVAYTSDTIDGLNKPDIMIALGVCHNVTPTYDDAGQVSFQAASPDEVAIIEFLHAHQYPLVQRSNHTITLGQDMVFDILAIFPFTSETKRMGIIVKYNHQITLYVKGADTVIANMIIPQEWMEEETMNMAREGLRVLAVAKKDLSVKQYEHFKANLDRIKLRPDRQEKEVECFDQLAQDMILLGLTGVEDRLQDNVVHSLETLREAGIRIWMLTGDKIETAQTIAVSTRLCRRDQNMRTMAKMNDPSDCISILEELDATDCLVIDGISLQTCLDHCQKEFIDACLQLPTIVCCRCSPIQKASVTKLIMNSTNKRVAAIGDGGNDVNMIQTSHCGIGIVGKEGKQASLAADFSITQFDHVTRLFLWHGRCCYKRTAKLGQFVIHRGLIISVIQAVFSSLFLFAPIALYQGALLVGYSTLFTMWPVFSLVLDQDVTANLAMEYPELYKDLVKGRSLSLKTFLIWSAISIYQGGIIMILALYLFDNEFVHIVAITFTALIFNELIMVAIEINTWHWYMIYAEVLSVMVYLLAMAILPDFDSQFITSGAFIGKATILTLSSCMPLLILKRLSIRFAPTAYVKIAEEATVRKIIKDELDDKRIGSDALQLLNESAVMFMSYIIIRAGLKSKLKTLKDKDIQWALDTTGYSSWIPQVNDMVSAIGKKDVEDLQETIDQMKIPTE